MDHVECNLLRQSRLRVFGRRFAGYDLLLTVALLPETSVWPFALRVVVGNGHRRGSVGSRRWFDPHEGMDSGIGSGEPGIDVGVKPLCGGLNPRIWMDESPPLAAATPALCAGD